MSQIQGIKYQTNLLVLNAFIKADWTRKQSIVANQINQNLHSIETLSKQNAQLANR